MRMLTPHEREQLTGATCTDPTLEPSHPDNVAADRLERQGRLQWVWCDYCQALEGKPTDMGLKAMRIDDIIRGMNG